MRGGAAFTVALVGPDGVGKTTIARRLEREFPLPLKYLYMGDNVDSSNVMLPTTRWWKRRQKRLGVRPEAPRVDAAPGRQRPRRARWRSPLRLVRKSLGFVNRILEETYRERVAAKYFRRGTIVLFDRHFILDYYHFDVDPRAAQPSLKRRLHGFFLRRISRRPDLVVCLDAPGEVVFRRKGEFSPQFLEMRRRQYREFEHLVDHFELVDANRELDLVVQDVTQTILRFERGRHNGNH
jgi:thymidylate kinase